MVPESILILRLIASGRTYGQILALHPNLTYPDIFRAAQDALDLASRSPCDPLKRPPSYVQAARERHPRAYEPWTDAEDAQLANYAAAGLTVARIAGQLQRKRSAIRSRIIKRDLVHLLSPGEQARLHRLSGDEPPSAR